MPTPPACWTASPRAARENEPSQTTILPFTLAGSRPVRQPTLPASSPSTIAVLPRPRVIVTPLWDWPLPSLTVPENERFWVLAAVAISHGPPWSVVLGPGPALPAEVATKTPAWRANRNDT